MTTMDNIRTRINCCLCNWSFYDTSRIIWVDNNCFCPNCADNIPPVDIIPLEDFEIIEEFGTCNICCGDGVEVKLECCGQSLCTGCLGKLQTCPYCRARL